MRRSGPPALVRELRWPNLRNMRGRAPPRCTWHLGVGDMADDWCSWPQGAIAPVIESFVRTTAKPQCLHRRTRQSHSAFIESFVGTRRSRECLDLTETLPGEGKTRAPIHRQCRLDLVTEILPHRVRHRGRSALGLLKAVHCSWPTRPYPWLYLYRYVLWLRTRTLFGTSVVRARVFCALRGRGTRAP